MKHKSKSLRTSDIRYENVLGREQMPKGVTFHSAFPLIANAVLDHASGFNWFGDIENEGSLMRIFHNYPVLLVCQKCSGVGNKKQFCHYYEHYVWLCLVVYIWIRGLSA